MNDDWRAVAALADLMGVDPDGVLHMMERAGKNAASAEVVLEGYRRTSNSGPRTTLTRSRILSPARQDSSTSESSTNPRPGWMCCAHHI